MNSRYIWTFVLKNRNRYGVVTEERNISEMLKNSFTEPLSDYSFALFNLAIEVHKQNFVLIRFSEISEILWVGEEK